MERKIEIRPGRQIHLTVHENNSAQKTIFLIHGLGGRSTQWDAVANQLKPYYRLVIPDLLGHGRSEKPNTTGSNPYAFQEFDLDIQALFQQVASDDNAVIGFSYGGGLATSLTIDHQDRISQLILLAPIPCAPFPKPPFIMHLPSGLLEWMRSIIENKFRGMAFSKEVNPTILEKELSEGRQNPMYMIKAMVDGMSAIPTLDATMLTIPTDIILCEKDNLVPVPLTRAYYESIPHHCFHTIRNASHMALLEKPETVIELIFTLLNRHCEKAANHLASTHLVSEVSL